MLGVRLIYSCLSGDNAIRTDLIYSIMVRQQFVTWYSHLIENVTYIGQREGLDFMLKSKIRFTIRILIHSLREQQGLSQA